MSKLLYIDKNLTNSRTWLTSQGTADWNSSSNSFYKSIVFTNDGYILTHGKTFNGNNNTYYAPTSVGSNGQVWWTNGTTPSWKQLITDTSDSSAYNPASTKFVQDLVTSKLTSFLHWIGDTASVPTTNLAIGSAWRASAAITLPAAKSATGAEQTLEIGDILICTNATTPLFTVTNTNWSVVVPGTVPTIGTSDTTIATIGGVAIKAKVAADANTWRNVYLEGDSKIGTGNNTKAINYVGGTGITASFLAAGTSSG